MTDGIWVFSASGGAEPRNRIQLPQRLQPPKRATFHAHGADRVGTLTGGNHFIELCLDERDRAWVMLHSGSRGIGNRIGSHFIALAREELLALDAKLPDRNLAYLRKGTGSFEFYVEALGWAQDYASENRVQMLAQVLDALRATLPRFETGAVP